MPFEMAPYYCALPLQRLVLACYTDTEPQVAERLMINFTVG